MPAAPDAWWQALYDELLAEVLLVRSEDAEQEATLAYLTEALDLAPGRRVFDQCCGIGSLALPLARLERHGFLILIGLIFILPMIGRQIGYDLNLFYWLVWTPVLWLMPIFSALAGVS